MGTLTGQQIVDRAWIKAQDTTGGSGVRWPAAEALLWLNDGQREVVNQLPKSYTLSSTPTVEAGTRQTLIGLGISDGISVVDITRNFNLAGSVPGRSVTRRDRVWFDDQLPEWHSAVGAQAQHWCYDERDPKAFYLYPAISGAAGKLEVIYSAIPTSLGALSSVIVLDDVYANALQWFVLFSFYSKDATYTKSPQMAASYWALFMQSLGFRDKSVMQIAMSGDAKAAGQGPAMAPT